MDHAIKRAPQGSNSYTGLSLRTPPPSVSIHRSCFWRDVSRQRNSGGFAKFDLVAEFFDAAGETLRGPLFIHAGEVERAEIAIGHLISPQIISRGQDRSGDRDNGLLRTAPCVA